MKKNYMKHLLHLALLLLAGSIFAEKSDPLKKPDLASFRFPHSFIENKGQVTDRDGKQQADILYSTRIGTTGIFFSAAKISYVFNDTSSTLEKDEVAASKIEVGFRNSSKSCVITADRPLQTRYNFYHTGKEVTGVKGYERITYQGLYDKIDLVFTLKDNGLKYDFILAPGADVSLIKMEYRGNDKLTVNKSKDLVTAESVLGKLNDHIPYCYTDDNGNEVEVAVHYTRNGNEVGFEAAAYDKNKTLVIDPVLDFFNGYGTGYSSDRFTGKSIAMTGMTLDKVTIVGETSNYLFIPGAVAYGSTLDYDLGFVATFDLSGALLWVSTLGGGGTFTSINDVANTDTYAFVCGNTNGPAIRPLPNTQYQGGVDAFMATFHLSTGVKHDAVYLGSASDDYAFAMAGNPGAGSMFAVGGYVSAPITFPVIPGSPTIAYNGGGDAFVASIYVNPIPGYIVVEKYAHIGTTSFDVVTDLCFQTGLLGYRELLITGETYGSHFTFRPAFTSHIGANGASGDIDVFAIKMRPNTAFNSAIFGTFIGDDWVGDYNPRIEAQYGTPGIDYLSATPNYNIYISFITQSAGLSGFTGPNSVQASISPAGNDNFLMVTDFAFSTSLYATYLYEAALNPYTYVRTSGVKLDALNNIYVFGNTNGSNITYTDVLTTGGGVANNTGPNYTDIFLTRINPDYTHSYTSLIGTDNADHGWEMTIDPCGRNMYMTGTTQEVYVSTMQFFNSKVSLDVSPPLLTITSSNGIELPSSLGIPQDPGQNVQWFFNSIPVPSPSANSFYANMPGTYKAVFTPVSSGCGTYENEITFVVNECEGNGGYEDLLEVYENEVVTGITPVLEGRRFKLTGDLTIAAGLELRMKECLVVGMPCAKIVVQNQGRLEIDGSALTGCPTWHGIVQEQQTPVFYPAVMLSNSGISRANIGMLSFSRFFNDNELWSEVTNCNFYGNMTHLAYVQLGAYDFIVGGRDNNGYVKGSNFLPLANRSWLPCRLYPAAKALILPNTQVFMHNTERHLFTDNYFYGERTDVSDITGIAGDHCGQKIIGNVFKNEYQSCIDIYNSGIHEDIRQNNIDAAVKLYGIRLKGDLLGLAHARHIEDNIISTTFPSRAGISVKAAELLDVIAHNEVSFFYNGIEYFQDRPWPAAEDHTKIVENTITALRSGIVVSYEEDPYNNGSSNGNTATGYGFEIFAKIQCNNIQAQYGILGTGDLMDQFRWYNTGIFPPVWIEEDAGNQFSCWDWDIIWGNNGTPSFAYLTPPGLEPNPPGLGLAFNPVVLDGSSYGSPSPLTNDFYSDNFYVAGGSISPNYCRYNNNSVFNTATPVKENMPEDRKVAAYPNPFRNELTLQAKSAAFHVEVYDITGRIVYSSSLDQPGSDKLVINTAGWEEGVYIVKVMEKGKEISNLKVVHVR